MNINIIACSKCGVMLDEEITKKQLYKSVDKYGRRIYFNECPCCKHRFNGHGDKIYFDYDEFKDIEMKDGDDY